MEVLVATENENLQENAWWISELDSLGVSLKVRNELTDIQKTSTFVENLKQILYQIYKDAYND